MTVPPRTSRAIGPRFYPPGDDPVLGLEVGPYSGSPGPASDLLAALEELRTADVPGGPDGIDWDGLATLPIDYEPDTSGMKGTGLPDVEVSQIYNVQVARAPTTASRMPPRPPPRRPSWPSPPPAATRRISRSRRSAARPKVRARALPARAARAQPAQTQAQPAAPAMAMTPFWAERPAQGRWCRRGHSACLAVRALGRQPARLPARRAAEQRPKIHRALPAAPQQAVRPGQGRADVRKSSIRTRTAGKRPGGANGKQCFVEVGGNQGLLRQRTLAAAVTYAAQKVDFRLLAWSARRC